MNGDTACTYAIITPLTGDSNPANNIINICDSVRNSWDPNEKTVSPAGPVSAGTLLTYTIDFENDGNDTAFDVHIQDTLSDNLNPRSFQLAGATHRVEPYTYASGSKNIIKLDFQNIKLPGKSDPLYNKGQVRFSIRMKDPLPEGTEIANRAGIYFDKNPVVLTNYARNYIPLPAGVVNTSPGQDIKVFPNPATDELIIRVSSDGWKEAVLSNALGQVMLRQPLHRGENILRVAGMPAGIYYLQAKGNAGTMAQKIEKR